MSAMEHMLQVMRNKHDGLNERLGVVSEERMSDVGSWGQRQMPIRNMFYQMINHEVEHTVHVMKTLRGLNIHPGEAQIILSRLQEARGLLEGLLVGISDGDLDRATGEEWSLRQVLQHIMDTEDNYLSRIEDALSDSNHD